MDEKDSPKNQCIKTTKINFAWFNVMLHLEDIKTFPKVFLNKEFVEAFDRLYQVVGDKVQTHFSGDISDYYIVFEQSVTKEK